MAWLRKTPKERRYAQLAIAKFDQLAPTTPIVDEERLHRHYDDLRQAWHGPGLVTGSLADITATVRADIERDATYPGYGDSMVKLTEDDLPCLQVSSVFLVPAVFKGYRVWRTPAAYALFGSSNDMIMPNRGRA